MSKKSADLSTETAGIGRRRFINTAALAGLTVGVAACNDKPAAAPAAAPAAPALRVCRHWALLRSVALHAR